MAATDRPAAQQLLAAALALLAAPHAAQAEAAPDQGVISLRTLHYLDRQPGADRVRIKAPSLYAMTPLGARWSLGGSVVHDLISGASPSNHTRSLGRLEDERNAADLSLTRYFEDATLTLGAATSHEADYHSDGLSVQGSLSSADRNQTWSAGWGVTKDRINPVNRVVQGERKRVQDWTLGLTQVLTPRTVAQLTLGHNRALGYLSDPYKLYDERPRSRHATRLLVRLNQHLEGLGATLRSSLRLYRDSYGVQAQTAGLEWVQPLPMWHLSLTPSLRLHNQRKASFYIERNPEDGPFATTPPEDARHTSLDQRLSAFGALTVGLKLAWEPTPDWSADIKFEHYAQRSAWFLGGAGSTGLAEFSARSWQVGLTRKF